MLQRMRELAVQAASGTMSTTDQAALSTEFEALTLGIDAIADNTQWNGTQLLDATSNSGAFSFQVGANASQTISVTIRDFTTDGGSTGVMENLDDATTTDFEDDDLDLDAIAITSASEATDAITELSNAITRVDTERAALGSVISRLEYAADNLSNVSQNTSASRSRILDADYASETTELARTQIIQQAGTAMLSQANQQAQSVLALLR